MGGPVPGPEQAPVTAPIIINQKLKQNLIILRSYEISSIYRYDFHFAGVQFLGQQILSLDIMKSEIAGTVSILLSMHLPNPAARDGWKVSNIISSPHYQCSVGAVSQYSVPMPRTGSQWGPAQQTAAQQRAAPGLG